MVPYVRMANETEQSKYRSVVKRVGQRVVRFVLISVGCILASVAGFVFLPSVEIPSQYPYWSINLSGDIGMVTFVAVVFAVEGFRGRLKSEWIECIAALACTMLLTFGAGWIHRIP